MGKNKTGAKKTTTVKKADAYEPNKDRRALRELVARHGEAAAVDREAFGDVIDDAQAVALGGRTKGSGVLRDAVAWGVAIGKGFESYGAALSAHYAVERFRYFLHTADMLAEALSAQESAKKGHPLTADAPSDREAKARIARNALLDKMRSFAGGRAAEKEALAAAIGDTSGVNALGASIAGLCELAKSWLGRPEAKWKHVAAAARLTPELVEAAMQAAQALTGAATEATLAGRRSGIDTPAVNLAEGRVLFEMQEAQHCWEQARRQAPVLPALLLGEATRHVLGGKPSGAKKGKSGNGAGGEAKPSAKDQKAKKGPVEDTANG